MFGKLHVSLLLLSYFFRELSVAVDHIVVLNGHTGDLLLNCAVLLLQALLLLL